MLFSWYAADYCADPEFASLPPEQRANPSMASGATRATSSSNGAVCRPTSSGAYV
jgi:hypothetical protein